jgi:TonB-dependent SusC/RagA subfamily outer membrane receptor
MRLYLLAVLFAGYCTASQAQSHVVYGVVHAFDSIPLADAHIQVKSTNQDFYTDSEGNFVVVCNTTDKLKIKVEGFQKRIIDIKPNIKIIAVNMQLKPGNKGSLYNIGYGAVDESQRTSANSTMAKNEASFSRYNDIFELIRGQFPGVEVGNNQINVRGSSSFNSSNAALIVLDGVIVDYDVLRTVRVVEVKQIDVIKDGTAAVYGSRGANGVVLIETNKGGDKVHQ